MVTTAVVTSSSVYVSPSCRHKRDFRFNQNPPIENTQLRHTIEQYEKHHGEISRETIIGDFLHTNSPAAENHNKYIFLSMTGGLGNQMLTVLSYYMLGLLTDRILLINATAFDVNNIFCEPFPKSSWKLPTSIDKSKLESKNNQASRHSFFDTHDIFLGSKNYDNIQIWEVHGDQYFVPLLFMNPAWRPRMDLWFPNRAVATPITRYLIHPVDRIWHDIVDTYSNRRPGDMTIGIQVREPASPESQHPCIHDIIANNTHVFIASLGEYQTFFQEKFPLATVTQKYHDRLQRYDVDQVSTALHDIWVLSLTDELLLAPQSTFGYIAMSLKGEAAIYPINSIPGGQGDIRISGYSEKDVRTVGDQCFYVTSHEPCYHMFMHPRGLLTPAQREEVDKNTSIYMAPCEDVLQIPSSLRLRVG